MVGDVHTVAIAGREGRLLTIAVPFILAMPVAGALVGSSLGVAVALVPAFAGVALALIVRARRRRAHAELVHPTILFAVGWTVYLAVPLPYAMLTTGDPGGPRAGQGWLAVAGGVAFASLLLVSVGADAARRWEAPRFRLPDMTPPLAVALALLGFGTRFYLIATGSFGYLSHGTGAGISGALAPVVASLSVLAPMGTAAIGYLVATEGRSRPILRWGLSACVALTVTVGVVSGFKAQMVTDLIPLGVILVATGRRLPWKLGLGLVLMVALVRPGVQQFREDVATGSLDGSSAGVSAVVAMASRVDSGVSSGSYPNQVVELGRHALSAYRVVPDNLALILKRTGGDRPFLGLRRAILEPIPFVPLSVANGRPFSVSQYVNVEYHGGPPTSSSPASQPGDLYLSGGWPAVLVGQLVVGLFLGALWQLVRRGRGTSWIVLYAVLSPSFLNAGTEFGLLLRGTMQRMAILVAVLWLVAKIVTSVSMENRA